MLYDLSIPIEEGMTKIPILPEVKIREIRSLKSGDPLEIRELNIATHIGTHMDAPSHAIQGGLTIDEVPLDVFCGSAVVIEVDTVEASGISLKDVLKSGVEMKEKDIVLIQTGMFRKQHEPNYHLNPYFLQDLADYLVEKKVKFVGVDCITVDMPTSRRGPGFDFPIHRTLLANETLIVENLGDMSKIVGQRGYVWAFPIHIKGSDAAHVRVVFSTSLEDIE